MPQNLGDDRISTEGIAYIRPEDGERLSRYLVRPGDIVYSRRGDVTKRALVGMEHDGWLCGTGCLRVRFGNSEVNPRYAFYYLGHPLVRDWITRHAIGATLPNLNTSILSALPFLVPPPSQQGAIAEILGTLDDKIELNRRMNETLEAMARAIFKSWFVDFDPVKRNQALKRGETAPSSEALAKEDALFPDSFQESPLGKIPRGWTAGALGDLVELGVERVEATPDKNSRRYVALDDMPSKSVDLSQFRPGSEVNSSIIAFREGDILFGAMRPYFHKVGLAQFDGICRTTTFVLRPRKDELRHFALFHFSSDEVVEYSTTASVGTTIPYIKWDALARYDIVIPLTPLMRRFEETMRPLTRLIGVHGKQSLVLVAIRDALLPKLISGEIRVKDAGKLTTATI